MPCRQPLADEIIAGAILHATRMLALHPLALVKDQSLGNVPLVEIPERLVRFYVQKGFPIVCFLGGYGQSPEDFVRVGDLLNVLIASGQLQNMYFAFLPGDGGKRGSFYVNQVVPHAQVPDLDEPTTGRYEDSILPDLMPEIEGRILEGRVKR